MAARKSYREMSSGLSLGKLAAGTALGVGGAKLAMAGAGAAAGKANNFRKWLLNGDDYDDGQEVPSDGSGYGADFGVPEPLMLSSGPTNGYGAGDSSDPHSPDNGGGGGGQHFDAEASAEPIEEEQLALERETGRVRQYSPNGAAQDGSYGSRNSSYHGNGTAVADPPHGDFDGEQITDAEVVDDNPYAIPEVEEDRDVMDHDSREGRERRMDNDLREERMHHERSEREQRRRRERNERER
jgi:hypothetical protein